MPFHLQSLWGATLMLHRSVQWTATKRYSEVGKNSGPVLSRLWAKVHEILRQRRRPFVLYNGLVRLSMSRFVQQIFAIKSRSRRKPNKCKVFGPQFFSGETNPTFVRQIVSATYHPQFVKVWLSSVCWFPSAKPGNADFTEGGWKLTSNLKPFVDQSLYRFETM